MPVIRIALVEDDISHVQKIKEYLDRFRTERGLAFSVRVFNDGEDITENYAPDYDIIFLDIQMRFMDGMSAARLIRKNDPSVTLIFLTSMSGYAIQGYEVDALDYIVKPVSYELFARKLERAIDRLRSDSWYSVLISSREGTVKMPVSRILYIEASSHQMTYHTKNGSFAARGRLDDLEKELAPYGFFRINRGTLVSLTHVSAVRDGCCVIENEMLPISQKKKSAFMEELTKLL